MTPLKQSLRRVLKSKFGVKTDVKNDTKLFTGGLLDSMSVMDLVVFVEDHLHIVIAPADIVLDNFDTIDNIQRFADRLLSEGAAT